MSEYHEVRGIWLRVGVLEHCGGNWIEKGCYKLWGYLGVESRFKNAGQDLGSWGLLKMSGTSTTFPIIL